MSKKKYHGGLKLLLLLLFIMLLGLCSTSYASMSSGYLDYIITTLHDNAYISNATLLANFKSYLNNITEEQKTTLLNNINTYMEQQGISNLQDRNIFCLIQVPTLKFFICNNSSPGSTTNLDFYCIADNYIRKYSSSTIDYIYQINVDISSSPTTINTFRFPDQTTLSGINFNTSDYTISQDGTVITSRNIATCGIPAGFQFVPLSNYNSSSKKACILQDVNGGYVEPTPEPEPSGDSSSGTGTITNPSGDVTGQIDLSGIEQGIGDINNNLNNIENKIHTSGDMQNVISGEVGKITNILTDTDTDLDASGELSAMVSSANITDPTTNFFSWLLDSMEDFFSAEGVYYLEFDFFTKHIKIGSDFFVLPDGDLKTFFQTAFLGWFGWIIIKKIRYIVYAIQCVRLQDAFKQVDFNPDIL